MNKDKVVAFVFLVDELRKAQREYFRLRKPSDMKKSMSLERHVDVVLRELLREIQQEGIENPGEIQPFLLTSDAPRLEGE
jgi:hypothetical protein